MKRLNYILQREKVFVAMLMGHRVVAMSQHSTLSGQNKIFTFRNAVIYFVVIYGSKSKCDVEMRIVTHNR